MSSISMCHWNLKAIIVGLIFSSQSFAQNWPSFRGPNASGLADGFDLPILLETTKAEWKTEIPGLGHSSPIIWGGRVFLTTAVSDDPNSIFIHGIDGRIDRRSDKAIHGYLVYALDRLTGEVVWKREAARGIPKIQRHRKNSYASSTPVTDGVHVVAYFGSEGVFTYDLKGDLLWKKTVGVVDAGASYDDTYDWGPASSPIIYNGKVILLVDQQGGGSFMVAFNVATGAQEWRVERDVISSFSTPTIFHGSGRVELITNGAEWMHGYDPSTGNVLWQLAGSSKNTTPTPVVSGNLVFITSGYRIKPIFAVQLGGRVQWSTERDGSYMTTPIVYGDYLYTCQDNGVVSCYRKDNGNRVYQRRVAAGAFSASPIASDGNIFFTSEDGEIYVVRAGPEYKLVATSSLGAVAMATPAATKGQLLIRTQQHLWSFR